MERPPRPVELHADRQSKAAYEIQELLYTEIHAQPNGLVPILRKELHSSAFQSIAERMSNLEERICKSVRSAAGITPRQWNTAARSLGRDLYEVDEEIEGTDAVVD